MKILMVLSSHDQLGKGGRKTGFWLQEFAAPYFVPQDAGVELAQASPRGRLPENQTPAMTRFKRETAAQKELSETAKLFDMKSEDFIALIESFYNSGKPMAAVCHPPAVVNRTFAGVDGRIVTGRNPASSTAASEALIELFAARNAA